MKKNLLLAVMAVTLVVSFTRAQTIDTLVDVGGYRLHFHLVKGTGTTILFESGGGNDGSIWKDMLPPLSTITGATLITYDRAGFGKSEMDTTRHGILNGVKALETGLKKLGYDKDLMLVPHSLGGFYSALYAFRNPEKVKAVVLIDANLMCFYDDERIKATQAIINKNSKPRSTDLGNYYISKDFQNTMDVMKGVSFPSQIPITDIVSDITPFGDANDINDWKRCHKLFTEASPNRKSILALGAGHYVFLDNPALAVGAIVMQYAQLENPQQRDQLYRKGYEYSLTIVNDQKGKDFAARHSENDLNSWGYSLMRKKEYQKAIEVFKLNTMLHPESANTYDSEAEAYEALGDKSNAIKNYQRSLELDPKNTNAEEHIKRLRTK